MTNDPVILLGSLGLVGPGVCCVYVAYDFIRKAFRR